MDKSRRPSASSSLLFMGEENLQMEQGGRTAGPTSFLWPGRRYRGTFGLGVTMGKVARVANNFLETTNSVASSIPSSHKETKQINATLRCLLLSAGPVPSLSIFPLVSLLPLN